MSDDNNNTVYCPKCDRSDQIKSPRYSITKKEGKEWIVPGVKLCERCKVLIPIDKTLLFWNGKEAVEYIGC